MYSSQLVLTLKTLREEELQQFDRYLHSPYFHSRSLRPELLQLWQYLRRGLARRSANYFTKEKVYIHLFPDSPGVKSKLEKLMSRLYGLLKSFLVVQQMEEHTGEGQKQLFLLKAFSQRQLQSSFEQQYRKLQTKQEENKSHWNSAYFYDQFLIQSQITAIQSLYSNRKGDLNLPNTHFHLDLYYLVVKLEYAFQLLNRDMFVFPIDKSESLHLLDTLIPQLSDRYLDVPIVQLYLSAYQFLQVFYESEGEKQQIRFNGLLEQYAEEISYTQLQILQTLNRNYYVYRYQKGDTNFLAPTFQLYQSHLQQGFLYAQDQILPGMLSNIVTIGLRNKDYDWVYQFLLDHQHRIGGTNRPEIVFQFNLGHYYFYIREYEKALDQIAPTYEDLFYKAAARRLEVKILYEMDSDIFDAKLQAFKLFIYRLNEASASAENKLANQHFVDLLKQIRRPRTYKNGVRIEKLLQKALGLDHLADKEWIVEKLEKLR